LANNQLIAAASECSKSLLPAIGGKAASLGELVKAGAPVPPFFVITSDAYRHFIQSNGLDHEIARLQNTSADEALKVAAKLRHQIVNSPFPTELEEKLVDAFKGLTSGWGSVAVRSSATLEDALEASFAGQYETYLGVRSDGEFLESVKKCFASLFTDRAVTYRMKMGLPQDSVRMAVIAQALVKARSAGVMFTVNPLNGDPSMVVIESSWGLGEAVVKGEVTPDKYSVNKISMEVLEVYRSRSKPVRYEMLEDGTVVRKDNAAEESWEASLSLEEAVKLAEMGASLEKYFGAAQDIEWVVDQRRKFPENIFLVQSRPVTIKSTVSTPSKQSDLNPLDRIINTLLIGVKV